MSLGPIRPRFSVVLSGTVDHWMAVVQAAAGRPERRCVARKLSNHVDLAVVREDRHRWSPCVQLEFCETDESTTVNGLIGPHPNLWTLFAFVYIHGLLAAGLGLMIGLVQRSLDLSEWGWWLMVGGVVVVGLMYVISQAGQRLAEDQTRQLIDLVEDALGTSVS